MCTYSTFVYLLAMQIKKCCSRLLIYAIATDLSCSRWQLQAIKHSVNHPSSQDDLLLSSRRMALKFLPPSGITGE